MSGFFSSIFKGLGKIFSAIGEVVKAIYDITIKRVVKNAVTMAKYIAKSTSYLLQGKLDRAIGYLIRAAIILGTGGLYELKDKYKWVEDIQSKTYNLLNTDAIMYLRKQFPVYAVINEISMYESFIGYMFKGAASNLYSLHRWYKQHFNKVLNFTVRTEAQVDLAQDYESQLKTVLDSYVNRIQPTLISKVISNLSNISIVPYSLDYAVSVLDYDVITFVGNVDKCAMYALIQNGLERYIPFISISDSKLITKTEYLTETNPDVTYSFTDKELAENANHMYIKVYCAKSEVSEDEIRVQYRNWISSIHSDLSPATWNQEFEDLYVQTYYLSENKIFYFDLNGLDLNANYLWASTVIHIMKEDSGLNLPLKYGLSHYTSSSTYTSDPTTDTPYYNNQRKYVWYSVGYSDNSLSTLVRSTYVIGSNTELNDISTDKDTYTTGNKVTNLSPSGTNGYFTNIDNYYTDVQTVALDTSASDYKTEYVTISSEDSDGIKYGQIKYAKNIAHGVLPHYVVYKEGSGDSDLDRVISLCQSVTKTTTIRSKELDFLPLVPLKAWDISPRATTFSTTKIEGKTMTKWLQLFSKKAFGKKNLYLDICDQIPTQFINTFTEQRSDFAMFSFGVPVNSTAQACKEYMYKFMETLLEKAPSVVKANTTIGIGEYNLSEEQANGSVHVAEIAANGYNLCLESSNEFYLGALYKFKYVWKSITKIISNEPNTKRYYEVIRVDATNVDFIQHNLTSTVTLRVEGFTQYIFIIASAAVGYSLSDLVNSNEESTDMIIPIEMNTFKRMRLYYQNELPQYINNVTINIFTRQQYKVHWWQRSIFKVIVIVVIIVIVIVISIVTYGTGSGPSASVGNALVTAMFGTAAAATTAGVILGIIISAVIKTIVSYVVAMVLSKLIYAITGNKLVANLVGCIVGAIAGGWAVSGMTSLTNTLMALPQMAVTAIQGVSMIMQQLTAKNTEKIQALQAKSETLTALDRQRMQEVNEMLKNISSPIPGDVISSWKIAKTLQSVASDPMNLAMIRDLVTNPQTGYNAAINYNLTNWDPSDNDNLGIRSASLYQQGILGDTYTITYPYTNEDFTHIPESIAYQVMTYLA